MRDPDKKTIPGNKIEKASEALRYSSPKNMLIIKSIIRKINIPKKRVRAITILEREFVRNLYSGSLQESLANRGKITVLAECERIHNLSEIQTAII